jgi:hypothetical protein
MRRFRIFGLPVNAMADLAFRCSFAAGDRVSGSNCIRNRCKQYGTAEKK